MKNAAGGKVNQPSVDQPKKRSKGKLPKSAVRFLPQLPEVCSKPQWNASPPSFLLREQKDDDQEQLHEPHDLSPGEFPAPKAKKSRKPECGSIPGPSSGRVNGAQARATTSKIRSGLSHPKRDREQFRSALVDIIMQQDSATSQSFAPDDAHAKKSTALEKDILVKAQFL